MLRVPQVVVNSALDSRQYHCGCKCTSCCDWVQEPGEAAQLLPAMMAR